MIQAYSNRQRWKICIPLLLLRAGAVLVLFTLFGCKTLGALAPSTIPIPDQYTELTEVPDVESSCGYAFLMLPLGNPLPVADIIDYMIKVRGGDALINVSSDSTSTFFLLGSSNCVNIRGTVVKFG